MAHVDLWRPRDDDGLWDWNLVTNRIHFSPRWLAVVGCAEQDATHTPEFWIDRIHPEDRDGLRQQIDAARSQGIDFESHHRLRHHDGTYRWMVCHGNAVRNDVGQIVRLTGTHADASVAKVTDHQTGLPNCLLLLDRTSHAIERGHRNPRFLSALLLLELGRPPGFPPLAPEAESVLLASVARRLETCLRTRDQRLNHDLVARLDGDAFAVLLEGLDDLSDAPAIASRILATLVPPVAVQGDQLFLTVSIGIALSATGYQSAKDMLRDAGTAAHRARAVRSSHAEVFDTALLQGQHTEDTVERELKGALDRREFYLVYQPIVSLDSRQIVGFEALVRWQHPSRGVIAPADFIPLAERSGVIVALGTWILREACLQLKRWQQSSAVLSMSVNLSRAQLKHPALLQEIAGALRDSDVDPRSVSLELTESMAMDDPVAVKTLLMQLRALGVRVSIDDFGTGHSSLACLRDLPVDTLKIDRSFISGIEHDEEKAAIARTLTGMARELGLSVIAEGIENDAQAALLRTLQCDLVQGFLFAKPLDVQAATDLLKAGLSRRAIDRIPKWRLGRWGTAAAALLIVFTIGATARFTTERLPAYKSPTVNRSSVENLSPPAFQPAAPAPSHSGSRAVADTRPVAPEPLGRTKINEGRAKDAISVTPVPIPPPAERVSLTIAVEHLHRLGACRGQLTVSQKGLAFVPDQTTLADAFSLTYGELLASTTDTMLIVKSNTKTYRFKPLAKAKHDAAHDLHEVSELITAFR